MSHTADRLPALAARLSELDGHPVDTHPDVLEDLHRELVGELDGLARWASSNTPSVG